MPDVQVYAPTTVAAGQTTLSPVVFPAQITGLQALLVANDSNANVSYELDFTDVSPDAPPDTWAVGDSLQSASGTGTCGGGWNNQPPLSTGTLQAVITTTADATFSCTVTTP